MPREVKIIRKVIMDEFEPILYKDDLVGGNTPANEQRVLSRALSALVARRLLGCTSQQAADSVVDGLLDCGLDAIAISDSGAQMWLIQGKWSDLGNRGFTLDDARALKEGAEYIDDLKFDRFNERVQDRAPHIEWAWRNTVLKATLVLAVMGTNVLQAQVRQRVDDIKAKFNVNSPGFLDYEIWDRARIWQAVQDDHAEPPVEVSAVLNEPARGPAPYEAYQGMVSVSTVAEWLDDHGVRLFDRNIRQALGLTSVNREIIETLVKAPRDFWYLNNGITVLCDSTDLRVPSKTGPGPWELTLKGASVVNGAQTVASIHAAMRSHPDQAGQASVNVKVITMRGRPVDFGTAVTTATNTQNRVEARDFVAIDPVQRRLRQDFTIDIKKQYTYKRGEPDPVPDAGCSVLQVAMALACSHSNPELAVRTKINPDTLWERGTHGTYKILFLDSAPSASHAWRSVQVFRAAQGWLAESRSERSGRGGAIAEYGDLLVVHLVFQQLPRDLASEPDDMWPLALARVPTIASSALGWLIHEVDAEIGQSSSLKGALSNTEQCRALVGLVLANLRGNTTAPELPAQYQAAEPSRRPNAVTTLINAGQILEGTKIIFKPRSVREHQWVDPWLAGNPQRAEATWVNSRSKPLLWGYDGEQYSPSGLTAMIWAATGWPDHPVSVQGPRQWYLEDGRSLWDLAKAIQDDQNADGEEP
jgi:hypothetical protein